MNKKKIKNGSFLMFAGLLLVAAALALVLYNSWDARRAQTASAAVAEQLDAAIAGEQAAQATDGNLLEEMPTEEIDGYSYIGILDLPTLGLHLPVMENWDEQRLKISPCRYAGSYLMDDMVICAHNYAKHFSSVKWIDIGADVYFTTVTGEVYHYQVSNRETLAATAVETMVDQEGEDWDLTLFTCNTGGQTRCAVRCMRVRS